MRFEGEEDAEVVEGEVVGRSTGPAYRPAGPERIYQVEQEPYAAPDGQELDLTGLVDAGVGLAMDPKARALALLVKVPLLAYVALSDKMPVLVRLAAAGLGAAEVLEALQRQRDYEQLVPPELR